MKLDIGGVHTPAEQDKVLNTLTRALHPLIVSIIFRPCRGDVKDEVIFVEGTDAQIFPQIHQKISTVMAQCAFFYHEIVRQEDTVLTIKTRADGRPPRVVI